MQKPFNADFYATAAAVIPVFFVALTLQGNTYRDVMTRFRKAEMDDIEDSPWFDNWWPWRSLITELTAMFAFLAVVFGVVGSTRRSGHWKANLPRRIPNRRS